MDITSLLFYFAYLFAPAVVGFLVFRLAVYLIKVSGDDS